MEEVTLVPTQVQTTSSTANNNLNVQLSSGKNKLEYGTDSDKKSFSHDIESCAIFDEIPLDDNNNQPIFVEVDDNCYLI